MEINKTENYEIPRVNSALTGRNTVNTISVSVFIQTKHKYGLNHLQTVSGMFCTNSSTCFTVYSSIKTLVHKEHIPFDSIITYLELWHYMAVWILTIPIYSRIQIFLVHLENLQIKRISW